MLLSSLYKSTYYYSNSVRNYAYGSSCVSVSQVSFGTSAGCRIFVSVQVEVTGSPAGSGQVN